MAQQRSAVLARSDRICRVCGSGVTDEVGRCDHCGAQIDWSPPPHEDPEGQLGGWAPSERAN
eukprot:2196417-Alexandrium_andersonii.AAC.1